MNFYDRVEAFQPGEMKKWIKWILKTIVGCKMCLIYHNKTQHFACLRHNFDICLHYICSIQLNKWLTDNCVCHRLPRQCWWQWVILLAQSHILCFSDLLPREFDEQSAAYQHGEGKEDVDKYIERFKY